VVLLSIPIQRLHLGNEMDMTLITRNLELGNETYNFSHILCSIQLHNWAKRDICSISQCRVLRHKLAVGDAQNPL
jgi:hypothetical protein